MQITSKRPFVSLLQTEMPTKRRRCLHSASCVCNQSHLTEDVLLLVFRSQNWNPFLIAAVSQVCRWFSEVAKRLLWKKFCLYRAPKMVSHVVPEGRGVIEGGWDSLGRLMIYCAGLQESWNVHAQKVLPHFARTTRFSKTSGRSFLVPECRSDVLYISDPCEHQGENGEDDIGLFRGVFRDFLNSKTRKWLIDLHVQLEIEETCPYCFNKVWSLLNANMIPKSAHRRLGAHGDVEYFVCLHGHLYGHCLLLHLSDSEVSSD